MVKKKTIKDYQRELRKERKCSKMDQKHHGNLVLKLDKEITELIKQKRDLYTEITYLNERIRNEREINANLKIIFDRALNISATTITIVKKKNDFLEKELHETTQEIIKNSDSNSMDFFFRSLDFISLKRDRDDIQRLLDAQDRLENEKLKKNTIPK